MRHPFCIMPLNQPNIFSEQESNWNNVAFANGDDTALSNVFDRFFTPGLAEHAAWSREMTSQMYQNHWNSEVSRMARAKEAGINLNTAAAAIAGSSGTQTMPAQSSQASPDLLQGAASAANAASSAAEIPSVIARNREEARKLGKEADNVDRRSDAEVLSLASSFAKNLTDSGTPEIEAMVTALSVCRGGLDGIFAALKGDGVCRLIHTKQDKIEAEFSKIWKDIEAEEWDIQHTMVMIDEVTKKNLILDIEKRKQEAITKREEQLTSLWDKYDGDPYLDLFQRQYQLLHDYGEDSPQYQSFLASVKDLAYHQQKGINKAEIEDTYKKFVEKFKAENDVEAEFAEFFSAIRQNEEWVKGIINVLLTNGGSFDSLYNRLVSIIAIATNADFDAVDGKDFGWRMFLKPRKGSTNPPSE